MRSHRNTAPEDVSGAGSVAPRAGFDGAVMLAELAMRHMAAPGKPSEPPAVRAV